MESKVCPGLYCIGEVLNIDGLTGGFNFQSCVGCILLIWLQSRIQIHIDMLIAGQPTPVAVVMIVYVSVLVYNSGQVATLQEKISPSLCTDNLDKPIVCACVCVCVCVCVRARARTI